MTYSVGGLIQAVDWNTTLVGSTTDTTANRFNTIWGPGASSAGYGQTAFPQVSVGGTIQSGTTAGNQWAGLVRRITDLGTHQNTTIQAMTPAPTNTGGATASVIYYFPNIATNLTNLYTNRLNAAAQGSTATNTATSAITWRNSLTMTFTATFASADALRYFFNAGGQFKFSYSHPAGSGTSINQVINGIASQAGTTVFSAPNSGSVNIAGTSFNGVTKVGGSGSTTISTNSGYYGLSGTTQLMQQVGTIYYHGYGNATFMRLSAADNGSGVLTFTVLWDEIPNGATVSSGTSCTMTVAPPSTTYLTNSWGTPTLSNSVTGS